MDIKMTDEERQVFLSETRVGIISIAQETRGPLTVPVWYDYKPGGEVRVWTSTSSRKFRLLGKVTRISFCVQEPTPSYYKYVSIEGPFTLQQVDPERDIHGMALRYYGKNYGEQYFTDVLRTEEWKNTCMICIHPERWYTADFSKDQPENR